MGKCSASSAADSLGFLSAATPSLGAAESTSWEGYQELRPPVC
jgi:hypothetical protein